jgi:hypothetical protein
MRQSENLDAIFITLCASLLVPGTSKAVIPSITDATDKRCVKVNGQDRCKTAIQTNNVETDDRGYVYIVDRANTGMHILESTGEARAIAGLH